MTISVESLVYRYPNGLTALDDVSFAVEQGERVAIIGQNGAGKTTLVRHFNAIFQPTSGRVVVDGLDTRERTIAEMSRKVGYVFQNPNDQLFARSVAAEVSFGPRNIGYDDTRIEELVAWALEATRLTDLADDHPYHLSLAERKRVALASVIAMDTTVVVLDEPTTGQDHVGVGDVAKVVAELSAQGKTVVAITHDMDFCVENFDRVLVMAQGKLLSDGSPANTFSDTAVLAQAAVEQPQLMRLAGELGIPEGPRTVADFVRALDGVGANQ